MRRKPSVLTVLVCVSLILPLLSSLPKSHGQGLAGTGNSADHIRKGMEYFDTGFYELAPKRQAKEADHYYELAAGEFKKALSLDSTNVEASRRLGRVYYVQKRYSDAAELYKKVTILDPDNPDAYLDLADTYARLKNYREAIVQLEVAKTRTDDPVAIEKLNGFIDKLKSSK